MQEKINEMARTIDELLVEKPKEVTKHAMNVATYLFDRGYRKQEWISVDDKLPTWEDGKVLIYTTHGISIAQRTTSVRWQGDLAKPKWITHWMPLPSPPKEVKND